MSQAGERSGRRVAVVLAGAAARGAYEAGALSVLLPALGSDHQPDIYIGTSAGAINSAGFASFSHLDPEVAGRKVVDSWRGLRQGDVFRPPLGGFLRSAVRTVARAGKPRLQPVGLLDTAPLTPTLRKLVNWDQLHVNIRDGALSACGVVATDTSTHRSTVFLEGRPSLPLPKADPERGIRFVRATLGPDHVVASSSLPGLFPAAGIVDDGADGAWYVDGGVRLNAPLKPALMLDADYVVVVATSPASVPPPPPDVLERPPGVTGGLVDIMRAVTEDRMVEDLSVLARKNETAAPFGQTGAAGRRRTVKYVFSGPAVAGELSTLARDVLRARRLWPPPGPLARLAARSPDLCELMSHVLFDREFIAGSIELGQCDARAQLTNGAVQWRTARLAEEG